MQITIERHVAAPVDVVWRAWTTPEDIVRWNAASDDWHTTRASVDLREGGTFSSRMEAKDGSAGFDFEGTYTKVEPMRRIEAMLGDRRLVVEFEAGPGGTIVRETFDADDAYPEAQQRAGWEAILERFARHVEGTRMDPSGQTRSSGHRRRHHDPEPTSFAPRRLRRGQRGPVPSVRARRSA